MCVPGLDPVTLAMIAASTAATTGGAMYNADTQNNAIEAQNREDRKAAEIANVARQQEAEAQRGMERQQADEVGVALAEANPAQALLRAQQTVAAPENAITDPTAQYNAGPRPGQMENKDIEDASAGYKADSKARSNDIVKALAMLTALNGETSGINDALQRSGSDIQTIGLRRRTSMDANRLETSIPGASVTPSDSILGDVLMIGGQALGGAAGTMAGTAAAPGTSVGDLIMGVGKPRMSQTPWLNPNLRSGGLY